MTRPPWAERFRQRRLARGWSQEALAARLRMEAGRQGRQLPDLDSVLRNVKRWEAGMCQPSELYAELLTAVFAIPDDQARGRLMTTDRTAYQLAGGILDWRSLVTDLRQSSDLLCCLYAIRPPAELIPPAQQHVRLIDELLRDGTRHYQRELVETAGWLHLLLAALHCGLGQMGPAWASRDSAFQLATELQHAELIGWSHETASFLSFVTFDWRDMLEAAEEGVRRSPPRYSAMVQNTLKVAHARAALGDPAAAERSLDAAMELVARMDQAERAEHHFMFDAPKFDKFAAEILAASGRPVKAAYHARVSIARSDHPDDPARNHPMRASCARVALASALFDLGELDEACAAAAAALRAPFLVEEVVGRVGAFLGRLRAHHEEPAVVRLAEEYRVARSALK